LCVCVCVCVCVCRGLLGTIIDKGSVLQCVAVCYSVLQYVAVCHSVLQCVAVCCTIIDEDNLLAHSQEK